MRSAADDQGPFDLGAGRGPAGVKYAGRGVAALTRRRQCTAGLAVEHRAQCDQLLDAPRALVHQQPHGVGVAEPRTRRQGVGEMQVGGVLVPPSTAAIHPGPNEWLTGTARPS